MAAYWFFFVYVSPVLLVMACAFLAWRAYNDNATLGTEEDAPGGEDGPTPDREEWSADPDAWKKR